MTNKSTERSSNKDKDHKQNIPIICFNHNDYWSNKQIKDLAEIIGGGTPSTNVEEFWNGNINWFTPTEVGQSKYVSESERKITKEGLNNSSAKLLPKNTILLTTRATIGRVSITTRESTTNQGFQSIICKNVDMNFMYYLIQTLEKTLIRKSVGSTFLEISKKEIENIEVKVPDINEQKKIGKFISLIDQKIELMEIKRDKVIKLKNYFIQKLFYNKQEMENIPELRFPEFKGEWREFKLKELSKIQRGASPRPINDKKWYDNDKKSVGWVRIGDVTKSSRFLYETEDYFSEEGVKKSRFLPKGSLIMSICATIGKPIITGIDTCIHDGFVGFSELNNIDKEFLYYILKNLEQRFESFSQTGSQANLNTDLINNAKVYVPVIEEQKRIVNLISIIDQKIELMEKEIKIDLNFKKTLLNKMFC